MADRVILAVVDSVTEVRLNQPEMLMMEATEQQALLTSLNHREAIEAHAEKRIPVFRD